MYIPNRYVKKADGLIWDSKTNKPLNVQVNERHLLLILNYSAYLHKQRLILRIALVIMSIVAVIGWVY